MQLSLARFYLKLEITNAEDALKRYRRALALGKEIDGAPISDEDRAWIANAIELQEGRIRFAQQSLERCDAPAARTWRSRLFGWRLAA